MSQIDRVVYVPLLFWFCILFAFFYFFIFSYFLSYFFFVFRTRKIFIDMLFVHLFNSFFVYDFIFYFFIELLNKIVNKNLFNYLKTEKLFRFEYNYYYFNYIY